MTSGRPIFSGPCSSRVKSRRPRCHPEGHPASFRRVRHTSTSRVHFRDPKSAFVQVLIVKTPPRAIKVQALQPMHGRLNPHRMSTGAVARKMSPPTGIMALPLNAGTISAKTALSNPLRTFHLSTTHKHNHSRIWLLCWRTHHCCELYRRPAFLTTPFSHRPTLELTRPPQQTSAGEVLAIAKLPRRYPTSAHAAPALPIPLPSTTSPPLCTAGHHREERGSMQRIRS